MSGEVTVILREHKPTKEARAAVPRSMGSKLNVDVTTAAEGGLREKSAFNAKNSQAARSQAKHEQPRMAGWAALSQAYQLRIPGYP